MSRSGGHSRREGSWDELTSTSPPVASGFAHDTAELDEKRLFATPPPAAAAATTSTTATTAFMAQATGHTGMGTNHGSVSDAVGVKAKPKFLKDSSFVEALTTNVTSTMSGWLSYLPTSVSKRCFFSFLSVPQFKKRTKQNKKSKQPQHSRCARGEPKAKDHLVHLPACQGQAGGWPTWHLARVSCFFDYYFFFFFFC